MKIILAVIGVIALVVVLSAMRMSGICSQEEERYGNDGKC